MTYRVMMASPMLSEWVEIKRLRGWRAKQRAGRDAQRLTVNLGREFEFSVWTT